MTAVADLDTGTKFYIIFFYPKLTILRIEMVQTTTVIPHIEF